MVVTVQLPDWPPFATRLGGWHYGVRRCAASGVCALDLSYIVDARTGRRLPPPPTRTRKRRRKR